MSKPDLYLASETVPICRLEVKAHFDTLSDAEKLYAHYVGRACWLGTRIVLHQVSAEAPLIYDLILGLHNHHRSHATSWLSDAGVSEEDWNKWQTFAVQFLGNLGNYKSFGDTKFIPRISQSALDKLVTGTGDEGLKALWKKCQSGLYALEPESVRMLGYPGRHCSAYYSPNISKDEIQWVQELLESKNVNAYNTRVFKLSDTEFVVKTASAKVLPEQVHQHQGKAIRITFGDYQEQMQQIADALAAAIPHAANDFQKQMLAKYVESFTTGSIDAHKDSQRFWIKDVGPNVESNIGFIESYRDPHGVRAEWEGFVAMVNKEQTEKFGSLVSNAPKFIAKLPWDKSFEKDQFHKPDFTSLEVLAFCTSGIPAGINIPNYDDIRQVDGFKNVSLGNVLNAQAPGEVITFLNDTDRPLFEKFRGKSFEVQVGIHELLGHGSGKLLEQGKDGKFNFDPKNPPKNPVTGKPVDSWYKAGETYPSKFGSIASSYEECRAECCGIYLSTDYEILKIFGHEGKEADDVLYINWLLMVRAGLLALEFYDPATKNWGQAHMKARYAILRVLLKAGQSFVTITPKPDYSDAVVQLDRAKIQTVGKQAIGDFLSRLQVFKATADIQNAGALYDEFTSVPDDWLKLRDLVLNKRQPRKVFVQANTKVTEQKVEFIDYEPTMTGMIQSFAERQV